MFQPPGASGVADLASLLKYSVPVSIVLCRVWHPKVGATPDTGPSPGGAEHGAGGSAGGASVRVDLLSTLELEWRVVLPRGEASLALELTGVGDEAKMGVPVGVLHVDLALDPGHGGVVPFGQVRAGMRGQWTAAVAKCAHSCSGDCGGGGSARPRISSFVCRRGLCAYHSVRY